MFSEVKQGGDVLKRRRPTIINDRIELIWNNLSAASNLGVCNCISDRPSDQVDAGTCRSVEEPANCGVCTGDVHACCASSGVAAYDLCPQPGPWASNKHNDLSVCVLVCSNGLKEFVHVTSCPYSVGSAAARFSASKTRQE